MKELGTLGSPLVGSLPGSPYQGQLVFLTSSNTLQYYDGSSWKVVGTAMPSSTPTYASVAVATNTQVIAAPGAGLSIYVTDMEGSNAAATATTVTFYEGAGTTARYTRVMAAGGGGFATNLNSPWKLPANTALSLTQSAANQGYYTVNYYVAA